MISNKADKLKIIELANKYNLEEREVELMIRAPYEFIRSKTKELDFSEEINKEDFDKMKTNFNIPAIGKLYASHYLHKRIMKNKSKKS